MMKKLLTLCLLTAGLLFGLFSMHPSHSAAVFAPNRVMDDGVFDNTNYTANQIDTLLNSYPNSCISQNRGFTAADPIGYSVATGYQYGSYVSAGRVIYDAAIAYDLNPRVLVATLQKEEGLVKGDGPYGCGALAISASVGYGCPDSGGSYDYSNMNPALYAINGVAVNLVSGTCVNDIAKVGFSQQLIRAAWLLKFGEQRSEGKTGWAIVRGSWNNSDDLQACYGGPMTQGTFKRCPNDATAVPYDGYTTINNQSTHMDTGATAALYWYTPHFSGNQSFVNIYEGWFGPTKGVDYSWQFVDITITAPGYTGSNVQGAQQSTVTITAQNTGNQAWSNTNFPVRLGTYAPTNHGSALYDSSWTSPIRPATLTEATVAPGQNGHFTFKINPPNISGTYLEHFNPVAEGTAWMAGGDYILNLNITPSQYTWQMVSQVSSTGSFDLRSGQSAQFTLVAKNTGNVTWNNSVKLATWAPSYRTSSFNDGSWPSASRAATLQEASVAPGQNGTFVFNVIAPPVSFNKTFVERFNLVMEGTAWFTDPWLEFDVNVKPATYTYQMVSQTSSTGSFTLSTNQTANFTLVVKNTGNVAWANTGTPVKLATWNPPYSRSPFDPGSWEGPYRAATLQEASVAPGQNGTFVFSVKMPSSAGSYNERFNLVMEGVSWFTDPWLEFDTVVH